jgi:hypothetical protein
MRDPVLDRVERPAVEQVRGVHGVAGVAQRPGKAPDRFCESERVVEHDNLGHC